MIKIINYIYYLNSTKHSFINALNLCTACGKVCIIFNSYPQVLFYLVFDGLCQLTWLLNLSKKVVWVYLCLHHFFKIILLIDGLF